MVGGNISQQNMLKFGAASEDKLTELGEKLRSAADALEGVRAAFVAPTFAVPEHMSANALLQAVNLLYTLDELREITLQLGENHD